ncbi:MAG: GNAT family N-acetyltransferase [Chloroflexota bacterium]
MNTTQIIERAMSDAEFARMNAGFDEHALEHGNPLEESERYGFVALNGAEFVGCSSCLVYRHEHGYNKWANLTDLFVEKPYRHLGLGSELLAKLEAKVQMLGVEYIYTWTAGYEAPGFYQKQGYQVFAEFEKWYVSGHARVGLRKTFSKI